MNPDQNVRDLFLRAFLRDFNAAFPDFIAELIAGVGKPPESKSLPVLSAKQLELTSAVTLGHLADPLTEHRERLINALAQGLTQTAPVAEFDFQEIVNRCREADLFPWLIEGAQRPGRGRGRFIPSAKCRSKLGLFLERELCNRPFVLPNGETVTFHRTPKGPNRRLVVQLCSPSADHQEPDPC